MSRGISSLQVRVGSCAFAAGCVGGLVNFVVPPLLAALHVFALLRVDIAPTWSRPDCYQKLVWGGLWGFAFLAPLHKAVRSWRGRALLLGCLPSLAQCLVVFPLHGAGLGGVRLGWLLPALVLLLNTAGWSLPAYYVFTLSGYEALDGEVGDAFGYISPVLDDG